jgi:hypothetical protein
LLLVGLLEFVFNRLAVPLLRPLRGPPPLWHTALDYGGLFLFYFASLLAVVAVVMRGLGDLATSSERRVVAVGSRLPMLALGALSAWAILVAPSEDLTFAIEVCLAATVVATAARTLGGLLARGHSPDFGVAVGVLVLAVPLLAHFVAAVGGRFELMDTGYDGPGPERRFGALLLAVAALASPYCLAPRPFVRSVTKVAPVLIAIAVAALAALLLRTDYLGAARAIKLAIGIELQTTRADPQLTLYLLAIATISWTIASCAFAATAPRRMIGVGLALLVLGGHGFQWPLHYLLLALGITAIADSAVAVKRAESAVGMGGPVIDDAIWGRYLGAVATALRRRCTSLHALTTRDGDHTTTSVLVGEADGRSVRARIDRNHGVVIGVDIVIGRDLDLLSLASAVTLTVVRDDADLTSDAPTAAPVVASGDAVFDRQFRCHGSIDTLHQLFDTNLRDRATTLLDGWLAYSKGESVRYRSYPNRGTAMDGLIPTADLSQGRVPSGASDRFFVTLEFLLDLAARGPVAFAVSASAEGALVASDAAPVGDAETVLPIGPSELRSGDEP